MNLDDLHKGYDPMEWATLYTLGDLSPEDKRSFEQHLHNGCPECQSELQEFGNVITDLAATVSSAPPAALRDRLLAVVSEDCRREKPACDGILLHNAGLLIMRSATLPWEAAPIPGILSKSLFVDKKRKYATSLVRVEPKAVYPAHRHNDTEEVFLLEGDFFRWNSHGCPAIFVAASPVAFTAHPQPNLGPYFSYTPRNATNSLSDELQPPATQAVDLFFRSTQ